MTDFALITTTINVPHLLEDYARNAKAHGRELKIYVSGDQKTPAAAAERCAAIARDTGVPCEYMDVAAQNAFMRRFPPLDAHLPWNCVQRRNVAILKAAADGADTVVTLDDDNFLEKGDYFGGHAAVATTTTLESFGKKGKWFNVCRFLREESGRGFFARGYSPTARNEADDDAPPTVESKWMAVNAGLWLGDPDIDAVTRLAAPINATGYERNDNFFVAAGAWTPFNSQNTAIAKAALPAYFLSPYVGRYDDIFAGFVVKRIADHLGHGVSFGNPLVRQNRNPHNLFHDMALENMGMKITDDFIAALESVNFHGDGYADCLLELCEQAQRHLRDEAMMTTEEQARMAAFFAGCQFWAQLPLWRASVSAVKPAAARK